MRIRCGYVNELTRNVISYLERFMSAVVIHTPVLPLTSRHALRRLIIGMSVIVILFGANLPRALVVRDAPQSADAIVVLLGDDAVGSRAEQAAELYRQGWAARIVFGTGYGKRAEDVRAQNRGTYLATLRARGIPDSAQLLIDSSNGADTSGELSAVADYSRQHGWKRILLVTSAGHSRRTDVIWSRVASGIDHVTIGAQDPEFESGRPWWSSRHTRGVLMHEAGGFLKEGMRRLLTQRGFDFVMSL